MKKSIHTVYTYIILCNLLSFTSARKMLRIGDKLSNVLSDNTPTVMDSLKNTTQDEHQIDIQASSNDTTTQYDSYKNFSSLNDNVHIKSILQSFPEILLSEEADIDHTQENTNILCPFLRMMERNSMVSHHPSIPEPSGHYKIRDTTHVSGVLGLPKAYGRGISFAVSSAQVQQNVSEPKYVNYEALHMAGDFSHECGLTFAPGGSVVSNTVRSATLNALKGSRDEEGRLSFNNLRAVKLLVCASQGWNITQFEKQEIGFMYTFLGGGENGYVMYSDVERFLNGKMPKTIGEPEPWDFDDIISVVHGVTGFVKNYTEASVTLNAPGENRTVDVTIGNYTQWKNYTKVWVNHTLETTNYTEIKNVTETWVNYTVVEIEKGFEQKNMSIPVYNETHKTIYEVNFEYNTTSPNTTIHLPSKEFNIDATHVYIPEKDIYIPTGVNVTSYYVVTNSSLVDSHVGIPSIPSGIPYNFSENELNIDSMTLTGEYLNVSGLDMMDFSLEDGEHAIVERTVDKMDKKLRSSTDIGE